MLAYDFLSVQFPFDAVLFDYVAIDKLQGLKATKSLGLKKVLPHGVNFCSTTQVFTQRNFFQLNLKENSVKHKRFAI